jgi:hypothetical protein
MTREQTTEIEQAVRGVLSEVLSEASQEFSAPASTSSVSRDAGGPPGGSPDETEDIPSAVLTAVEKLCRDLSPEQASTLAEMFEAMGDQPEEEDQGEDREAAGEAYADIELSSEAEARAQGERAAKGRLSAIIRLLKKSRRLYRAAVKAAKRGRGAFNRWVNSLSNFNPVKWAIKALPDVILFQLIDWLSSQREKAITGAQNAEIDQAVRKVLREALTEPQ